MSLDFDPIFCVEKLCSLRVSCLKKQIMQHVIKSLDRGKKLTAQNEENNRIAGKKSLLALFYSNRWLSRFIQFYVARQ